MLSTGEAPAWLPTAQAIDRAARDVTPWECEFLESLLSQRPAALSPKRQAVLDAMAAKYLYQPDPRPADLFDAKESNPC